VSNLSCLVFGCSIFVHSYNPKCSKLNPRALKCVFIGYPPNKKWYECYHSESCHILIRHGCHLSWNVILLCELCASGEKTLDRKSSSCYRYHFTFTGCSRSKWWNHHYKWDWNNPQWGRRRQILWQNVSKTLLWL